MTYEVHMNIRTPPHLSDDSSQTRVRLSPVGCFQYLSPSGEKPQRVHLRIGTCPQRGRVGRTRSSLESLPFTTFKRRGSHRWHQYWHVEQDKLQGPARVPVRTFPRNAAVVATPAVSGISGPYECSTECNSCYWPADSAAAFFAEIGAAVGMGPGAVERPRGRASSGPGTCQRDLGRSREIVTLKSILTDEGKIAHGKWRGHRDRRRRRPVVAG
jgi:hypothetical protein